MDEGNFSEERIEDLSFFSNRNAFWTIFKDLDNQKEGNSWTSVKSRPTLTNFRYVVVPIYWNDRQSDPDNPITTEKINVIMNYNKNYYDEMSFGKFKFSHWIHDTVRVNQPSKNPDPTFGDAEREMYALLADEGYNHGSDFDGVIIIYPRTTSGTFDLGGGIANLNQDSK